MYPPIPADEEQRLKALYSCFVLDTAPEPNFDTITKLLCRLLHMPWAFVSLVDRDRQWFKSHQGIDIEQTERRTAFAAYAILQDDPLIVPDATQDERFAHYSSVTGPPFIRFYAGVPLTLDGKHRIGVLCVASPTPTVIDEQGVQLLKDLSGIVLHELELRRAVDKLAAKRERLRLAERMSSIGQLAAGIAHEINSPLQYISLNLEFIRDAIQTFGTALHGPPASPRLMPGGGQDFPSEAGETQALPDADDLAYFLSEAPQAIAQAQKGVSQISAMVSSLRDYSYVSVTERVPTALNEVMRSAVTITSHEWKRCAEIFWDLDAMLPETACNPDQISQVLVNLIVNACHSIEDRLRRMATIPGAIHLRSSQQEGFIVLEVEDNGAGIPHSLKAKIFEPFLTTKEHGRGSGQGLAISYDIVARGHSGHLRVESDPTALRTTFSVWIPRVPTASEGRSTAHLNGSHSEQQNKEHRKQAGKFAL
jgi:hypothetical protein